MIISLKNLVAKKVLLACLPVSACFGQAIALDPSFDTDGKVTTPVADGLNLVYDMALQSDGKIVAVGYALTGINYDIAIARYNTDGSLDVSFNTTGTLVIELGSNDDVAYGVAIQSDGKIVIAGSKGNGSNTDFLLMRLNSDGTNDNSFDTDGIVTTTFDVSFECAYDVAIQSDGKIVAAGNAFMDTTYNFALARYNTNGSLDGTFGTGGKVTTLLAYADEARAMAIQSDGKIVLTGLTKQADFSIAFGTARYNTDGSLDNTFNSTGKVITSVTTYNDTPQAIALQSDGKIVVAGKGTPVGPEQFAVVRYTTTGALDVTWNGTGMVTTAFGSTWDEARAVVIQSDGKVLAGGLANSSGMKFAMARYNTDGTLDATFGTGGKMLTPFGSSSSIWTMLIQPDSKLLTAGYSGAAADYDFGLARFGPDTKPNNVDEFGVSNNNVSAYPNPFTNNVIFEYSLQNSERVSLQLVSIEGKVIVDYFTGQLQDAGVYQQNLAMPDDLANGNYLIVLSTPSGKASLKVVKE